MAEAIDWRAVSFMIANRATSTWCFFDQSWANVIWADYLDSYIQEELLEISLGYLNEIKVVQLGDLPLRHFMCKVTTAGWHRWWSTNISWNSPIVLQTPSEIQSNHFSCSPNLWQVLKDWFKHSSKVYCLIPYANFLINIFSHNHQFHPKKYGWPPSPIYKMWGSPLAPHGANKQFVYSKWYIKT